MYLTDMGWNPMVHQNNGVVAVLDFQVLQQDCGTGRALEQDELRRTVPTMLTVSVSNACLPDCSSMRRVVGSNVANSASSASTASELVRLFNSVDLLRHERETNFQDWFACLSSHADC